MKDDKKIKVEFGETIFLQDREEFIKGIKRDPRRFLRDCEKGIYLDAFKDRTLVIDIIDALDYDGLDDPRLFDVVFRNNIKATIKDMEKADPTMTTKQKKEIAASEYRGFCVLVEDRKDKQKLFKEYYDGLIAESDPVKDADMVVDEVFKQSVQFKIVDFDNEDSGYNK